MQENPEFDPEGIYHTKALEDHESLMEYLNSVVPTETTHNLMRVSEANHWNKNTIKGTFSRTKNFKPDLLLNYYKNIYTFSFSNL